MCGYAYGSLLGLPSVQSLPIQAQQKAWDRRQAPGGRDVDGVRIMALVAVHVRSPTTICASSMSAWSHEFVSRSTKPSQFHAKARVLNRSTGTEGTEGAEGAPPRTVLVLSC